MKKSKVLIPAMALLLFSTAASVTSTVAWFSSTRVYNQTVGDFKIAQIDGNLACDPAGGVGTFVNAAGDIVVGQDADNDKTADANTANLLLDGSFNHTTTGTALHAFRLSRDGDTFDNRGDLNGTGENAPGTLGKWWYTTLNVGTSPVVATKYYVAVSWTLTFKYTFHSESKDVGVYLDLKGTQFDRKEGSEAISSSDPTSPNYKKDSAKGMRIAFIESGEGGKRTVFGNRELGTNPNEYTNLKYINGTANNAKGTYSATDYNLHDGSYDRINDSTSETDTAHKALPERVCTITIGNGEGEKTKTVTCVAWFEGEDPDVVNGTAMAVVGANLQFYARLDNTATTGA